jgi:hypothetical protein
MTNTTLAVSCAAIVRGLNRKVAKLEGIAAPCIEQITLVPNLLAKVIVFLSF